MHPAQGIGKLGFRRWYERQLTAAFANFGLCLLCMIALAIAFEQYMHIQPGGQALLALAIAFIAFAVMIHALRLFISVLQRAEEYARGAVCGSCGSYGRFEVVGSGTTGAESPGAERVPWMRVRCRKCGRTWTIG